MRAVRLAVAGLLGMAMPSYGGAQAPDIDVAIGAGAARCAPLDARRNDLVSAMGASWPLVRFGIEGVPLGGEPLGGSMATVTVMTPSLRGLRVDATLSRNARGAGSCAPATPSTQTSSHLSWSGRREGFWAGFESAQGTRIGTAAAPADSGARRVASEVHGAASLGAWRQLGGIRVSLGLDAMHRVSRWSEIRWHDRAGVSVYSDSSGMPGPPAPQADTLRYVAGQFVFGAVGSLAYASGRLAINTTFGVPTGAARSVWPSAWLDVQSSYAITPLVSMLAVVTSRPDALRIVAGPLSWRMSFGFQLSTARFAHRSHATSVPAGAVASAFRVMRDDDGTTRIAVRAPLAAYVELTGDFTGWTPSRMQRVTVDWWELRLRLDPGVYRVNVRIDGARWEVPAGLPRQDDEFGGEAGIFVVP